MQIARSIPEMKALRSKCVESVGFVPTMGYLHEGHIELVRVARRDNPVAVVSIFVNPTQFAPNEDYKAYPRDLDRDLSVLDKVKTGIVFIPDSDEMYAGGYNTWVDVQGITGKLEGKSRPTHFRGVTTLVAKRALTSSWRSWGNMSRLRRFRSLIRSRAWARRTPGFSRATIPQLLLCRAWSLVCCLVKAKEVHTRTSSSPGMPNVAGITPTIR